MSTPERRVLHWPDRDEITRAMHHMVQTQESAVFSLAFLPPGHTQTAASGLPEGAKLCVDDGAHKEFRKEVARHVMSCCIPEG